MTAALDARAFVGRAPEQVDEFIEEEVGPVRRRYPHLLEQSAKIEV
jgi:adenylosuccinate lyase